MKKKLLAIILLFTMLMQVLPVSVDPHGSHAHSTSALADEPGNAPSCPTCGPDWMEYYSAGAVHQLVCNVCTSVYSTEDHSGGSNDTCHPVCDVCQTSYTRHRNPIAYCNGDTHCSSCNENYYSTPDPTNHAYTTVKSQGNNTHVWICSADSSHTYFEQCSGGDGSASSVCAVCGGTYDANACLHSRLGNFNYVTDTQHSAWCDDCKTDVYGTHGENGDLYDATCTQQAYCGTCYSFYGSVNPNSHSSLYGNHYQPDYNGDGTRHYTSCGWCGKKTYEDHTPDANAEDLTCSESIYCSKCDFWLSVGAQHGEYSDWSVASEEEHYKYCLQCSSSDSRIYEEHGYDDSCKPTCPDCGKTKNNPDGRHIPGDWRFQSYSDHQRLCSICESHTTLETEPHTPSDEYCVTTCTVCKSEYINYANDNPTHTGQDDWEYANIHQHVRICSDCNRIQYEDHTGGAATIKSGPICDVCGKAYGEPLPCDHTNMSDWKIYTADKHYSYCLDCEKYASYVFGDHAIADPDACWSRCTICNAGITNENGQHGQPVDWMAYSTTQHYRYCSVCYDHSTDEYEDHYTSAEPNCLGQGACEGCGYTLTLGEPNPDNHEITDWEADWYTGSTTQHIRYCSVCYSVDTLEYEDHYGGNPTCTTLAICEGCGEEYGGYDDTSHNNMSDLAYYNNTQHYCYCLDCGQGDVYANHEIEGGLCFGTCTECDSSTAFDPDGKHTMSGWERATIEQHVSCCTVCYGEDTYVYDSHTIEDGLCYGDCVDCDEEELYNSEGKHTMSDWEYVNEEDHSSYCERCYNPAAHEYEAHHGGAATCVSGPICDGCGTEYGEPDLTQDGHDYRLDKTESAACLESGLLTYICQHGGCPDPVMEIVLEAAGQHLFHNWQPVGDGTHISRCYNCGEELIMPCTLFATAENVSPTFAACPICGEYKDGVLPVLYAHNDDEALPHGTLVIRGSEAPADGILYAITVIGSYYGEAVELAEPITLSFPMELTGFRVIDMNGGEIAFTLENGMLTFTAEAAGLFLLVPAE